MRRLLRVIYDLAILPYPFPDDTPPADPRFAYTLGQIGGLCSRVLAETQDREAGDG
jgi:hypothetical protein